MKRTPVFDEPLAAFGERGVGTERDEKQQSLEAEKPERAMPERAMLK
jgi:hypothetical protein